MRYNVYILATIMVIVLMSGCMESPSVSNGNDKPHGTVVAKARASTSVAYITNSVPPEITFYGNWSNGTDLQYIWDFGDGSTAEGMVVKHAYTKVGSYMVTLTVRDRWNREDSDTIFVSIGLKETKDFSLPLYQTMSFNIPVEIYAKGIDVILTFPSGNVIGGKPTNEVVLSVKDTSGSVEYDTRNAQPDDGPTQVREIKVPNQDLMAVNYNDFVATVQYQRGTQAIDCHLEFTVSY